MISGKSFAERCAWVIDPRYPEMRQFSYAQAMNGDWVFVNGDVLYEFRRRVPMLSMKRFNVIVHNSDRPFGGAELQLLTPYCHHIYAINTTVRSSNLTTIPLGFVDRQLEFLRGLPPPPEDRPIEIYRNFTMGTNLVTRRDCMLAFNRDPRVVVAENRTVPEYYADLQRSKFVLCPEGTGIDTHRVYEALLCGATPVVLRNSLSHLYERLPVCLVNSWADPFTVPTGKVFRQGVVDYL